MDRGDFILEAIRKLYDAVLEPDAWKKSLPAVVSMVGGDSTLFLEQDLRTGRVKSASGCGHAPEIHAAFAPACEAGMLAPWMDTPGPGIARRSSAVMSDTAFARSDFYNETVRPTGTFHSATAALDYATTHRGFIAVGRRLGSDDFDSESIKTLQVLVPHLVTALRVRHQFDEGESRTRGAYAMLDRLDIGIVLTDASARPQFANARAEAIAAEADGFRLGARGVAAALPAETRALRRIIAAAATITTKLTQSDTTGTIVRSATSAMQTTLPLSRPSLRPPLTAFVMPLSDARFDGAGGAANQVAVFLIEPGRPPDINTRALAETYRLAPREVQVATLLAQGRSPAQIAGKLGIGLGTVREHLKRALAKTETHRQANLVQLLLSAFVNPVH
ncbi:helix-turn-helix transcriptional regulator [Reyranella sp.]|uniref:helix-turn-helix transcriptional regulator n=1 Tax=Reyranella sp. TaxID=1929291 RepID=UPI0011F7B170|nr:helix-turn-helix transcriptional regulator [Reyranella sp.]TAJ84542.1 MAG: LuxR family transcriptional regulator [Reyranella sp.]